MDTPLVVNDLDFSCVTCGDKVEKLQCLPCLHSVSVCEGKECREKLIKNKVSCSQCEEVFDFPVDGFPCHSFAKRRALSKVREEEGTFCCADHDPPQLAVAFCSNCPGPLCEECRSAHQTVALLKKHQLTSLDEALTKGLIDKEETPICPTHKEPMKYFCQDCEDVICIACQAVGAHQSHRVVFVDEGVNDNTRQPLLASIESASNRLERMATSVQDVDLQLFKLHRQCTQSKEDIAEVKNYMIEAVTNRCAFLSVKVEDVEHERRKDLEEYKKGLQYKMNQLEQFTISTKEIIVNGTTREQLSVCKLVSQRISTLTSTTIPLPPPSSSNIHFLAEKKEDVEKVLSTMGRLSLGAHPSNCNIEGLNVSNQTVICRSWSLSFKVITGDHNQNQCLFGGEIVRAVLIPTTRGVPVFGAVEDQEDGTYRVNFTSVPNQSELVVTVNGCNVRGCPVEVRVSDPNTIKQEIRDPQKKREFAALSFTKQGLLLATDNKNNDICVLDANGKLVRTFKVQEAGLYIMNGIVELSNGNIAVSLYSHKRINVYSRHGVYVKQFGSDRLNGPSGMAINNKGQLFVAEYKGQRVSVYSEDGEFQYCFGSGETEREESINPVQVSIGEDGLVYVSDRDFNLVQVFQQDGQFVRCFGKDVLDEPTGLSLAKDGHIVVASWSSDKLSIFTPSGECVHEVKGSDFGLRCAFGVAISNDGRIFVSDFGNFRIVKL